MACLEENERLRNPRRRPTTERVSPYLEAVAPPPRRCVVVENGTVVPALKTPFLRQLPAL